MAKPDEILDKIIEGGIYLFIWAAAIVAALFVFAFVTGLVAIVFQTLLVPRSRRRRNAERSNMANRKERRRIWLKCDDCDSEFPGEATYTILKLSEETGEERPVLDHILTRCARDPSHRPQLRSYAFESSKVPAPPSPSRARNAGPARFASLEAHRGAG